MNKLTGPVLAGLSDELVERWGRRAMSAVHLLTWEDVISSIHHTARVAAAYDGLQPAQVIERQISAVQSGLIHGGWSELSYHEMAAYGIELAPFCGCLVGWAGYAVGHVFDDLVSYDPLFMQVRKQYPGMAPIEILALILEPCEQATPQAQLVEQALQQALATL